MNDCNADGVNSAHLNRVDQYHQMIRSGIIESDARVELLENLLLAEARQSSPHCGTANAIRDAMKPLVPPGFVYRSAGAITLDDG